MTRFSKHLKVPSLLGGLLAIIAGSTATGCGPIGYTVTILSATEVVEEAQQAGAAQTAPYEYYYAQAHLDKAREEAGEAEYQNAMALGDTAREYGVRARDLARRRGREGGR